jgi:hypothetical protein
MTAMEFKVHTCRVLVKFQNPLDQYRLPAPWCRRRTTAAYTIDEKLRARDSARATLESFVRFRPKLVGLHGHAFSQTYTGKTRGKLNACVP